MKVELQRPDLLNLCKQVAHQVTGKHALDKHPFKQAFERVSFVNGYFYKLSILWANAQSDEVLFEFYKYHSPTIKLL